MGYNRSRSRQAGMVLLISLVFLLLLALLGVSSMQGAISQEKMTGSVRQRNQSFQLAESGLRLGESVVQAPGFCPASLPLNCCVCTPSRVGFGSGTRDEPRVGCHVGGDERWRLRYSKPGAGDGG